MAYVERMNAADVLEVLGVADSLGIRVWVDGGWAVDACLREQTRDHADLDLVVEAVETPRLVAALRARGFGDVPRDDSSPWNFVLGDATGRHVDLHVITIDERGDGVLGPAENGDRYPAGALTGRGIIDGHPVDCVAPEYLVRFHTGYDPDANDVADVTALCDRFGIRLPAEYHGQGS